MFPSPIKAALVLLMMDGSGLLEVFFIKVQAPLQAEL